MCAKDQTCHLSDDWHNGAQDNIRTIDEREMMEVVVYVSGVICRLLIDSSVKKWQS